MTPTSNDPRVVRVRGPRGFVLVIVVICGVAMLVIAMAIVFTGGAGALNSVKDASINQSTTIAEAGMERATAYATQAVKVERDFDKLLDPTLNVNCSSPPNPPIAPGRPRYTGATTVTFPAGSGVTWAVVPFNGGAYLTRFDDDDDDSIGNAKLTSFSGNNLGGGGNNCDEGPGATNGRNPFRDRNRAVWISVIGIYPGTDPARAQHRTSLRRFYIADEPPVIPVLAVDEDFDTGHLNFCSTAGDISVGGTASLSNQTDTCGTLSAQNFGSGNASADASGFCAGKGITCTHGGDADNVPFDLDGPPFDKVFPGGTASAEAGALYDFSSSCNFYLQETKGLYFWDADRGPSCAGHTGNLPAPGVGSPSDCWVPLMFFSGGAWTNPMGWTEVVVSAGNASWQPGGGQTSAAGILVDGVTYPAVAKPNWNVCPEDTRPSDFRWSRSGGAIVDPPNCTSCTGLNPVINGVTATGRLNFVPGATPTAAPTGVYYVNGNYDFAGSNLGSGSPGVNLDKVRGDWPMMTIIINGDATMNGTGMLGVGTALGNQMSLFVEDNMVVPTSGNKWAFAGSVYTGDDADFGNSSEVEMYGVFWVRDDLTIGNGGKLDILYDDNLVAPPTSLIVAPPLVSRTIR